jgi:hypothetical protein
MPAINVDDPAHWRGRSKQAGTLADEMSDETSRQMMLKIASGSHSTLSNRKASLERLKTEPPAVSPLSLNRAPIGWNEDDYDVVEDGVIVGRIFKVPIAPQDRHWMWASGHNGHIRRAAHGYGPTREAAMQAFANRTRGSPKTTIRVL